jgi:hypothetical protein
MSGKCKYVVPQGKPFQRDRDMLVPFTVVNASQLPLEAVITEISKEYKIPQAQWRTESYHSLARRMDEAVFATLDRAQKVRNRVSARQVERQRHHFHYASG